MQGREHSEWTQESCRQAHYDGPTKLPDVVVSHGQNSRSFVLWLAWLLGITVPTTVYTLDPLMVLLSVPLPHSPTGG